MLLTKNRIYKFCYVHTMEYQRIVKMKDHNESNDTMEKNFKVPEEYILCNSNHIKVKNRQNEAIFWWEIQIYSLKLLKE